MKILIFGAGVIGTIHAWALARSGNDVSLLVRPSSVNRWKDGILLDLLDCRRGKVAHVKERFNPRIVTSFSSRDGFELVIKSVKHTQSEEALKQIASSLGSGILLFFNNNWVGSKLIDAILPRDKYVLGLPRAGGSVCEGRLDGALIGEAVLGQSTCGKPAPGDIEAAAKSNLKRVVDLFEGAGIKPLIQENMEQFMAVHFATTSAWIAGAAQARGYANFSRSLFSIREALRAGKDAMAVCKARGFDPTQVMDARPFLAPVWLSAMLTKRFLGTPVSIKISAAHGSYAPEELQRIYYDVVETGRKLEVPMPNMLAFENDVKMILPPKT